MKSSRRALCRSPGRTPAGSGLGRARVVSWRRVQNRNSGPIPWIVPPAYHYTAVLVLTYYTKGFHGFLRDGIDGNDGTGRDGHTVLKLEPWSRPVDNFTYR